MKVSAKYSKTYSSDTKQVKHFSNIVYSTMALEGQKVTKTSLNNIELINKKTSLMGVFLFLQFH